MTNNILIQIQIHKSVLFVCIPPDSLQIYLIKIGLLNKYSKHKEFVGYNLARALLKYVYSFIDKVKVTNIEYNVKDSSFKGMLLQQVDFCLSKDMVIPIKLYSFDQHNLLFRALEISQYISLPIYNRARSATLHHSYDNQQLAITIDENTVQVNKQYRKEILQLEVEIFGGVHRCFIEVNHIIKILHKFFRNIDEVVCNDQLMLLLLRELLHNLVGDFIRLRSVSLQMLHKYVKLNVATLNFTGHKLKCFLYAHDTKIIDKFNHAVQKDSEDEQNMTKDFSLNFSVIKNVINIPAHDLAKISKDSILILGTKVNQDDSYIVDLGGTEALCQLQTNGSLKIMSIK